jgi:hypothetical protein
MANFDNIEIRWRGINYPVPPNRALGLIAVIEEALAPGGQGNIIQMLANPHTTHMTRFAKAYAGALRYAGCRTEDEHGQKRPITDEEVYLHLQEQIITGKEQGYVELITLANGLLLMLFPTMAEKLDENGNVIEDEDDPGNSQGAGSTPTPAPTGGKTKASSGASTKRSQKRKR